jgi:hypothetical protein
LTLKAFDARLEKPGSPEMVAGLLVSILNLGLA